MNNIINTMKTIKCKNCKYPVATAEIIKSEEKDIFINKNDQIAIKTKDDSLIARCNICNELLGISIKTTNQIMIFKEKITVKTLRSENKSDE